MERHLLLPHRAMPVPEGPVFKEPSTPPLLLAIGGLSGSGKSTLAYLLAPELGAVVLRSDVLRKELLGVAETTRLGPEGYRPGVTDLVYATLFARARAVLEAGQSIILDAVFSKQRERQQAQDLAHAVGAPFAGFWLEVPLAIAAARIAARRNDASDATLRVRQMQEERLERPILWQHVEGQDMTEERIQALVIALG
jgi:uncharacterized protein